MTPADRIQAACTLVLDKGYAVRAGRYGVRWNAKHKRWAPMRHANKCMCPLGALVVVEQPEPGERATVPAAAKGLLGVDIGWVIDFQVTWDGVCAKVDGPGADAARAMLTWLAQRTQAAPAKTPA